MNHEPLGWIYTYAAIISVCSVFMIAQLMVISWVVNIIENTLMSRACYMGFKKFKKWAYAILFATSIVSIGATIACIIYFKVNAL